MFAFDQKEKAHIYSTMGWLAHPLGMWCEGTCARRCPGRRFPDFGTGTEWLGRTDPDYWDLRTVRIPQVQAFWGAFRMTVQENIKQHCDKTSNQSRIKTPIPKPVFG